MTEQGNPGIYVQIDKWLSLYKGNVYVVDEIMGRMYLSKGEHLMRIAETASHCPFQDHELSISHHIPEREYSSQRNQSVRGEVEINPRGGEGGITDPITPIVGTTGGMGRMPVPVAESTCQPGEEAFTPSEVPVREGFNQGGMPPESPPPRRIRKSQVRELGMTKGEEPKWALPEPSEP